jgi:aldehyde:ferredoxin oxidoreductase
MGKILRVDLTSLLMKEEALSERHVKNYLGGAGFAIKYLYDELIAGTPALDKENRLIFAVGPLTATSAPCDSRMAVAAKSPLTSAMDMALAGGQFPAEMKVAGYDMIIIEGKAEKPIYISIKDGEVRFRNAVKLWGMTTSDVQVFIKEGASKGQLISQADLDKMLDEYYAERGWDKSGTPTPTKLRELGIKKH